MARYFGDHRLSDFRPAFLRDDDDDAGGQGDRDQGGAGRPWRDLVVGAVAHHVPEDREIGELNVIFDTASEKPEIAEASVVDVIAASADAPFFFVTPACIGKREGQRKNRLRQGFDSDAIRKVFIT